MSSVMVILASAAGVSLGILSLRWVKAHASKGDNIAISFLLMGIALTLLPVLLLQAHPSETYLYLPVGFYSILLSFGLVKLTEYGAGSAFWSLYLPSVIVLVVLFFAATWLRNDRVYCCGETARRILHGLPEQLLREGRWKVLFANVPGEPTTRRYGFYGFRGIDTVGDGESADLAITSALQLVYRNELLAGEVVQPQDLVAECHDRETSRQICIQVHWDGRVAIATPDSRHRISTP